MAAMAAGADGDKCAMMMGRAGLAAAAAAAATANMIGCCWTGGRLK